MHRRSCGSRSPTRACSRWTSSSCCPATWCSAPCSQRRRASGAGPRRRARSDARPPHPARVVGLPRRRARRLEPRAARAPRRPRAARDAPAHVRAAPPAGRDRARLDAAHRGLAVRARPPRRGGRGVGGGRPRAGLAASRRHGAAGRARGGSGLRGAAGLLARPRAPPVAGHPRCDVHGAALARPLPARRRPRAARARPPAAPSGPRRAARPPRGADGARLPPRGRPRGEPPRHDRGHRRGRRGRRRGTDGRPPRRATARLVRHDLVRRVPLAPAAPPRRAAPRPRAARRPCGDAARDPRAARREPALGWASYAVVEQPALRRVPALAAALAHVGERLRALARGPAGLGGRASRLR